MAAPRMLYCRRHLPPAHLTWPHRIRSSFSPRCGAPAARRRRRSTPSSSPAPSRRCPPRSRSGSRPRPRSRPPRWPPPSCGACAPAGASACASTCATRRSSFAANVICASKASACGRLGQDRRPLPLRRRPLGAPAHQPAASPRRDAQAARLRLRPRRGAACARSLAGGAPGDCRRRGRLVATASRSFAEWDAHPQGRAVAGLPLFRIERIGDAPPQPLPAGDRPLAGVKVLDLTRVIAGPVCGRTLAAHGADVLLVTAPHLPQMQALVIDNGRGKLSTSIDLRDGGGRETLAGLLRDADISCKAIGRAPSPPTASARRRPRACGPASSTSRSAPTAMTGRGRPAAASTRWCRTPTASTSRRPKRPVRASRSRCPGRRSITPPAT